MASSSSLEKSIKEKNLSRKETAELIGKSIAKKINMDVGTVRATVNKQNSNFVIQTPTSVASVKGTDFWMITDPVDGDLVIGLEGVVTLTNNETGAEVDVTEGTSGSSTPDGDVDVEETEESSIPEDPTDQDEQQAEIKIYFEGPKTVSAYIATPQGCGSDYAAVAPKEYWHRIREICDRYDVLLIADEVVTGFGRTGKWFAMEHFDVEADMMTVAKGITGCYVPMGAVVVSDRVNEPFKSGGAYFVHGFTNGGHPLGCAAATKALEIYQEDNLIDNSNKMGNYLHGFKEELLDRPCIKDVRGWGLMMCLEVVASKESGEYFESSKGAEGVFQSIALKNGLAFYSTLYGARREPIFKRGLPLMISPPISINKNQIDDLMHRLYESLDEWQEEMGVC